MEEQMKMAFMKDSGTDVEPTTGNKIPPGSLEKEVKDDVDAKLSEGEFVVPADVVQFYGVKHLTNMIDKAKEKLSEMDQKGQIGGEKPNEEEEEELPFDVSELQTEEEAPVEMAEGGLVHPWMKRRYPWMTQKTNTPKVVPQNERTKPTTDSEYSPGLSPTENKTGIAQSISDWGPDEFESFINGRDVFRQATQLGGLATGPAGMLLGGFARKLHDRTLDKATEALDQKLQDETLDPETKERYTSIRQSYQELQDEDRDGFFSNTPRDTPAANMGLYGEDKIPFNEGLFDWRDKKKEEEEKTKEKIDEKKKEDTDTTKNDQTDSSSNNDDDGSSGFSERSKDKKDETTQNYSKGGLVKKPATRK